MPHTEQLPFAQAAARVRAGAALDDETAELLSRLTEREVLGLLDGDGEFWSGMAEMGRQYNATPVVMGAVERLGVPGLRFSDGPRGVVMGTSTAFPVSMARGATWDVDLEERIGRAIGAEMRAQGGNFFGGVCINLPRHPAWGRAQETYGEDSYLLGEFGAALVRGVHRHGMAVAKHYALNSMENARFSVDVTADEATLHEVYLPHFQRVVDEGVDGIMTAYNSVNGEWAGQNERLLKGILREEWGFEGVTISDFIFGLRDAVSSVTAGLDVESPFRQQRALALPAALANGKISWKHVRRAAARVLRVQLKFAATTLDPPPAADVVFSTEHRALAREAAATSMVLLKNDAVGVSPLLPLDLTAVGSLALIGRLSAVANTGDHGSSNVHSPKVETALDGLRAALPAANILHESADDPAAAAAAAASADVAVVLVGYTAEDEGEYLGDAMLTSPELLALFPPLPDGFPIPAPEEQEGNLMGTSAGGDRASLRLRPIDVQIIRAVAAANARTVVAIVTAGAVIIEEWRDVAPAILVSWYAGSEGGAALADVLLGRVDASGRLPYSIPTDESHLPAFDRDATAIVYDRWHGQRLLDRDGNVAAFPLGFGLSYTNFSLSELHVRDVQEDRVEVAVTVANTGLRPGRHVVQLYGRLDTPDFPARVLLGFAVAKVEPGDMMTLTVVGSLRPTWRRVDGVFVPAVERIVLEASAYSGDPDAVTAVLLLEDSATEPERLSA